MVRGTGACLLFHKAASLSSGRDNTRSERGVEMADQDFRERVLESLLRIENKMEKGLDSLNTRVSTLERDVGWIKGKLEGKQEGSSKVLTVVTVCTAVGAAIIALVALLT